MLWQAHHYFFLWNWCLTFSPTSQQTRPQLIPFSQFPRPNSRIWLHFCFDDGGRGFAITSIKLDVIWHSSLQWYCFYSQDGSDRNRGKGRHIAVILAKQRIFYTWISSIEPVTTNPYLYSPSSVCDVSKILLIWVKQVALEMQLQTALIVVILSISSCNS